MKDSFWLSGILLGYTQSASILSKNHVPSVWITGPDGLVVSEQLVGECMIFCLVNDELDLNVKLIFDSNFESVVGLLK